MSLYTPVHPLVVEVCTHYSLRADILAAQIQIESNGNPWAWNPEPQYRYLWNVRFNVPFRATSIYEQNSETPPADFPTLVGDKDQEWWGQQASWGLLQVVGGTAREHGFGGPYLTELLDPLTGLTFGAKYLRWCLNRNGDDYHKSLARYNGSGARADAYATKVFSLRDTFA